MYTSLADEFADSIISKTKEWWNLATYLRSL